MPNYYYKGKLANGKIIEDMAIADSQEALTNRLMNEGIMPLEISEKQKGLQEYYDELNRSMGLDKPNLRDLSLFARQLHALTRAGVPVVQAIRSMIDTVENKNLKYNLQGVLANVESGQSLSVSMRKFPKTFPPIMISLVHVGENTGSLDQVFEQLSYHFERERETIRRIKEATRYPITVLLVISIAIIVINMVVIPAFSGFFNKFGAELPWPTKVLIKTSEVMLNYWYLLLLGLIGIILAIGFYLRTESGRYVWDRYKLKIPLVGGIIQRSLLARFVRAFALCIRTGVPLMDTINMIAKTTDNAFVSEKMLSIKKNIERGEALTPSAEKSGMFTPLVLQMMSVGEQSGDIEKLLDEVGQYYEEELDYDLKRLGDAIEPLLIVVIASMVLILALGVFLPMWDISSVAISGG